MNSFHFLGFTISLIYDKPNFYIFLFKTTNQNGEYIHVALGEPKFVDWGIRESVSWIAPIFYCSSFKKEMPKIQIYAI